MSSPEYAERYGARWNKVYDEALTDHVPPTVYGSIPIDIPRKVDESYPEAGVLEMNDGLLYGGAGWVFGKNGTFLPDHSWYTQHVDEIGSVPRRPKISRRLEGTCLSLASDFGAGSFGHFLLDCIARIDLFINAGYSFDDVDQVFLPKPRSGGARRILDHFSIPERKLIWADDFPYSALRADTLLAPSFPGTRRNYPPWVPAFLQSEFLPSRPTPSRRLYLSRAGFRRNASNEVEVLRILERYGFDNYAPGSTPHPARDFAEAEIVVAPHGGALTELAFCAPGTKVLELVPSDHIFPYFYTLSQAAGLNYSCMCCRSEHYRGADATGPSFHDFHVDLEEFEGALKQLTMN